MRSRYRTSNKIYWFIRKA